MTLAFLLFAVTGALLRRWWGGWFAPDSGTKRIVVVGVAFMLSVLMTSSLSAAMPITALVSLGFLMPKHGYGIAMGRMGKPLIDCLVMMTGQYTLLGCLMFLTMWAWGHTYMSFVVLTPLIYWAAWEVWERTGRWKLGEWPPGNFLIDGPTSLGELFIGASLFAGMVTL